MLYQNVLNVDLINHLQQKILIGLEIKEGIIEELHKPVRINFQRRAVMTLGIDDLWQADLVEMDSGSLKGIYKINKGYKYLLTVTDVF
jgi:hypothetical protein